MKAEIGESIELTVENLTHFEHRDPPSSAFPLSQIDHVCWLSSIAQKPTRMRERDEGKIRERELGEHVKGAS